MLSARSEVICRLLLCTEGQTVGQEGVGVIKKNNAGTSLLVYSHFRQAWAYVHPLTKNHALKAKHTVVLKHKGVRGSERE